MNKLTVEQAATLLKNGEVVAFPTETVYGLGACIFNEEAIQKVFDVKGRPIDNPLIAHICDLDQLSKIARDIPQDFYRLAKVFFPGPLTIVLKRNPKVPDIVSGGLDTIAVRMPSHPIANELIRLVGEPLVAPSANLSGKPSATRAEHVMDDLSGKISGVIDGGPTEIGIESTVISLISEQPVILRHGNVQQEEIEIVLGRTIRKMTSEDPVMSPGMKYRHYAPKAIVKLVTSLDCLCSGNKRLIVTSICAQTIYNILRQADKDGYEEVVVFCDEETLNDAALMDRLQKSAGG